MDQRHHALERRVDQQYVTVEQRVAGVDAERQRTDAELRKLVEHDQARAILIDARGLIPLALGVLLAGAPSQLAALPWLFAWPVPFVAAGTAVYTLYLVVIRDRLRRRVVVPAG
jgi:hypothetical protein